MVSWRGGQGVRAWAGGLPYRATPMEREPSRTAVRLVIQGRVQGVGYRWWALRKALELGLAGWVRNRRDATVEALAIGAPSAIARFAEACRAGPAHAAVSSVTETPADDDGSTDFEQRETV